MTLEDAKKLSKIFERMWDEGNKATSKEIEKMLAKDFPDFKWKFFSCPAYPACYEVTVNKVVK